MNSFKLTAVGHLAHNPELSVKGFVMFARFCLVGHDETTEDEENALNHETATSLWFLAFGEIAGEIARKSRKGDQLILEARVVANDWMEHGERQSGHAFVVTGFRFGAKRGDPPGTPAVVRCCIPPDTPQSQSLQQEADKETKSAAAA